MFALGFVLGILSLITVVTFFATVDKGESVLYILGLFLGAAITALTILIKSGV